ncbi:hypothetical protein CR513_13271, partial [Mucuna pruriens]
WSTYLLKLIVSLKGTNFKVWKEVVAIRNLFLFWITFKRLKLRNGNVKIKKWKCSNRMCLMIMKHLILEAFRGFVFESQR